MAVPPHRRLVEGCGDAGSRFVAEGGAFVVHDHGSRLVEHHLAVLPDLEAEIRVLVKPRRKDLVESAEALEELARHEETGTRAIVHFSAVGERWIRRVLPATHVGPG